MGFEPDRRQIARQLPSLLVQYRKGEGAVTVDQRRMICMGLRQGRHALRKKQRCRRHAEVPFICAAIFAVITIVRICWGEARPRWRVKVSV